MPSNNNRYFSQRHFRIPLRPPTLSPDFPPSTIALKAIDESWEVSYIDSCSRPTLHVEVETLSISIGIQESITIEIPMLLQGWLHEKAKEVLSYELMHTARKMGVTFNRVRIKNQRTLWGSCSVLNNINLNQKLLFLSADVMSYVLHHELTHLKVFNHSKNFWMELGKFYKDPKKAQKKLTDESQTLVPRWARM